MLAIVEAEMRAFGFIKLERFGARVARYLDEAERRQLLGDAIDAGAELREGLDGLADAAIFLMPAEVSPDLRGLVWRPETPQRAH